MSIIDATGGPPRHFHGRGKARLRIGRIAAAKSFTVLRANRRLVFADLIATACAAFFALALLTSAVDTSLFDAVIWKLLGASILSGALVYPLAQFYRRHTRSTTVRDVLIVGRGLVVALLVQWAILNVLAPSLAVPAAVYVIQFVAALNLMLVLRLAARHREVLRKGAGRAATVGAGEEPERIPVLLVGTGTNCDLFVRASRAPGSRYRPMGIIDDAQDTCGLAFHDIEILGSLLRPDRLCEMLAQMERLPQRLFLTEPVTQFDSAGLEKLVTWAKAHGVPVSRLPQLGEFGSGTSLGGVEPRAVDPEEILNRPQMGMERSLVRELLSDRRVLITGAGGSIGSELSRQVASFGPSELVVVEQSEFNAYAIDQDLRQHFPDIRYHVHIASIRDARRVNDIFEMHRPEIVFNAAALKHVPMVEANPCEGVLTNVIGTRNVADAARDVGAIAMVQISTDKAVNTTNVMGATKRVAEFYVQAQDRITSETGESTRFFSVRFGNVLGSSGSLIPLFQKQIAQGGPLTVTDDRMSRYFMTIREAVELTLVAAARGLAQNTGLGRIFVLDMGEPVKIVDIADRMIRLAGLTPGKDIDIEFVGIRPGEKLFEELFDKSETPRDCGIPGVQAAIPEGVPISRLRKAIHKLELAAQASAAGEVRTRLENLVPGYGEIALPAAPAAADLIEIGDEAPQLSLPRFCRAPRGFGTRSIVLPAGGFPT